jgi:broad specificity phosphatase PhoE
MKTTIYLTRHGEVHNPKKVWYGRMPRFGLTELGKKEIAQTAAFLQSKSIDKIYASPLLRAKQTAEIIRQKLQLPNTHYTKSLLEIRSSFEGRSLTYVQSVHFDNFSEQYRQATDETLAEIAARIEAFFQKLHTNHKGKQIVAVSHGDILMIARALIQKQPLVTASIRGKGYVQHGEVLEIIIEDGKEMIVQSVFKPMLN